MKNIALVGLYSIDNVGDHLICETCKFILNDHKNRFNIIELDALPTDPALYTGLKKLRFYLSALLNRLLFPLLFYIFRSTKFQYYCQKFSWKLRLNWYYQKVLPNCDALIFSGGGMLKYKTQGLNYLVEQILEICEELNIPVMFSGVGIEGFDRSDFRCKKLETALSSNCVKVVTTRDFIETLDNDFRLNRHTRTCLVGDPALWIPECYKIEKKQNMSPKVGINVIRGDIFRDYGNRLTPSELKSMYIDLLSSLDDMAVEWVLFSNGMKVDQDFGSSILRAMGKSQNKILIRPQSARDLVEIISGFDVIFGARMHACITAYSLDIPVVGLIWNQKLTRYAELTGQRSMFYAENEINVGDISSRLQNATAFNHDPSLRSVQKNKTKIELDDFLGTLHS